MRMLFVCIVKHVQNVESTKYTGFTKTWISQLAMGLYNVIKQFQTPETLTIKMIIDSKCCTATSGGRFFRGMTAVLKNPPTLDFFSHFQKK